ncbi:hypothetical protein ACSQ6I_23475 [Anabaena sp. WFMT]|uniref:hypothetical protein n=1 Tax=Anabaena sp. WFMT TaxID=3449730 RepID=UPI003F296AA4
MATLAKKIKLSDFITMSEVDARKRVSELYQASVKPTLEQLAEQKLNIDLKINFFESQYQMSSENMKQSLLSSDYPDNTDICTWLMLLRTRDRIEEKIRSSSAEQISTL